MPPTVQAVLAARIDRLAADTRPSSRPPPSSAARSSRPFWPRRRPDPPSSLNGALDAARRAPNSSRNSARPGRRVPLLAPPDPGSRLPLAAPGDRRRRAPRGRGPEPSSPGAAAAGRTRRPRSPPTSRPRMRRSKPPGGTIGPLSGRFATISVRPSVVGRPWRRRPTGLGWAPRLCASGHGCASVCCASGSGPESTPPRHRNLRRRAGDGRTARRCRHCSPPSPCSEPSLFWHGRPQRRQRPLPEGRRIAWDLRS